MGKMGELPERLHHVCMCVVLGAVAAILTGCGETFEMSGSFTCTDTTIATTSNSSCKAWRQEATTKKGSDDFILKVDYTCTEVSAQTGQCLAWSQSGSVTKESAGCFPQDAVVVTREGPRVMSEVRIGDELLGFDHLTDTIGFSTVRAWIHRDVHAQSLMIVLQTEDGEVSSSPRHSLAVVRDGGHKTYVFASEVRVGDFLFAHDGRPIQVTSLRAEAAVGFYSPLTGYSNFFAGRANNKSTVLAHSFAHLRHPRWFEKPVHAMIGASELFSSTDDVSLAEDDNAKYVHPWLGAAAALVGMNLEQGTQTWDLRDGVLRRLATANSAQHGKGKFEEIFLVNKMKVPVPLFGSM